MTNKYESYCYVCGEVVPEEQGVVEKRERKSGEVGFGESKSVVRHKGCEPQKEA